MLPGQVSWVFWRERRYSILFFFFWTWVNTMWGRISRQGEQDAQKHRHMTVRFVQRTLRKTTVVMYNTSWQNGHVEAGYNAKVKGCALEFRSCPVEVLWHERMCELGCDMQNLMCSFMRSPWQPWGGGGLEEWNKTEQLEIQRREYSDDVRERRKALEW